MNRPVLVVLVLLSTVVTLRAQTEAHKRPTPVVIHAAPAPVPPPNAPAAPVAPNAPAPGVQAPQVYVVDPGPAPKMFGEKGLLGFERTRLDFAPQGTGIENCANVPITNTTDRPRLLTKLISHDAKDFYISSPSEVMLPMTVGSNSTLFINVCFKPTEYKSYVSDIIAVFGDDTSHLMVTGKGVKPVVPQPIPKETKILDIKKGKHDWTIDIGLSSHGVIRLGIEDAMAHKIRSFPFDDTKAPGVYQVTFDGKDDNGKKIARGTYYLRLEVVNRENYTTIHDTRPIKIH